MKATMSDFDLLPSSDLLADENKVKLYHYWNALRHEIIQHFTETNEMIPFSTVSSRLAFEFSTEPERLAELWSQGADIVEGPIDLDGDVDADVDEELVDDFIAFMKERAEERAIEDDLFRSIVNEN